MEAEEVAIPLSKVKLILVAIVSLIFVLLSLLILLVTLNSNIIALVMGAAGFQFFGWVLIFAINKLRDKTPGLVINSNGINDNSSGVAVGLIPWGDIEGFSTKSVSDQRFLTVHLRNPDHYTAKAKGIKGMFVRANAKAFDSPVQFSSTALKCNFPDLGYRCQRMEPATEPHRGSAGASDGADRNSQTDVGVDLWCQ